MADVPSFGHRLRQTRKANNLTQKELAREAGCAATTLRLIESDKRRPSKQLAQRLAVALNISAEDRAAFLHQARTRRTQNNPIVSDQPTLSGSVDDVAFLKLENEFAECKALLKDPACRLLTLLGPSGVGKTRLAAALATAFRDLFRDGVVFVPLAQSPADGLLVTVILESLGVREHDQYDVEEALLDYLDSKELLLILDDIDYLMGDGTLLARMLQLTPSLKILVTSRERLALQAEWLYDLSGD